jgi:hypothetical protein
MARYSRFIAAFAGFWSVLCFVLINYNLYAVEVGVWHYPAIIMGYQQIITECVWIAPTLALFIFRGVIALVMPYAVILLIIMIKFIGRDIVLQKFDWADLLLFCLGLFSIVVVFLWIAVRSVFVLQKLLKR